MDLGMPDIDGLEATRTIKHELPRTIVVVLTAYEDPERLFEALKAGARGYLLKSAPPQHIIFFNFNRINSGLNNHMVREHMHALFGAERAEDLRRRIQFAKPFVRPSSRRSPRLSRIWGAGSTFPSVCGCRTSTGSATTSFS